MSKWKQIILSFLLFITIVFTVISLTVFNERFVYMVLNHSQVSLKIARLMGMEDEQKEKVKEVIRAYIQSGYQESSLEKREEYRKYVFLGTEDMIKKGKWACYLFTLFFLLLTGNILVKTKQKHQLSFLLFVSGLFLIFFFGGCVLFEKESSFFFHHLYQVLIHLFLSVGILLVELSVIKRIKVKKSS